MRSVRTQERGGQRERGRHHERECVRIEELDLTSVGALACALGDLSVGRRQQHPLDVRRVYLMLCPINADFA